MTARPQEPHVEDPAPPAAEPADVAALAAERDRLLEERRDQEDLIVRLRARLLKKERQLDELKRTVDDIRRRYQLRDAPPPTISRTSDRKVQHLATAFNAILAAGGVEDLRAAEIGRVEGGTLHDLLMLRDAPLPWGAALESDEGRTWAVRRAWLRVEEGRVALVLDSETDGVSVVELPGADLEAWAALGLSVDDVTTVGDVHRVLAELVAEQGYRVVSVGGFDGVRVLGLELEAVDTNGVRLRTLRAERAEIEPEGPCLVLHDGIVAEQGAERPFWRGTSRLPLPRADLSEWLALVDPLVDHR